MNFLVTVYQAFISIDLVLSLNSYDWQCEISGEIVSYKIKVDRNVGNKKLAEERANQVIVDHALNYANGGVIKWKTRGFVAKNATKKQLEIQSKMRKLL